MINDTSISVCVILAVCLLPRLLYSLIKNKRSFPDSLFKKQYLLLYIGYVLSAAVALVVSLLLTDAFLLHGLLVLWIVVSITLLSLGMLIWIFFFMHGYDIRFIFKKYIMPCPLAVIESILILISGAFTLNYYLIGVAVVFFVFCYLWSYKGYKLTKPIAVDEPEKDLEEY